jgi:hypothetical protein
MFAMYHTITIPNILHCGTYMAHIIKCFHTFDLKYIIKNNFNKKTISKKEMGIKAGGLDSFCKFIILHGFWGN